MNFNIEKPIIKSRIPKIGEFWKIKDVPHVYLRINERVYTHLLNPCDEKHFFSINIITHELISTYKEGPQFEILVQKELLKLAYE
jgi:hypothetical protein